MTRQKLFAGIDAGSVTLKLVLSSQSGEILFTAYERHRSDPLLCLSDLLARSIQALGPYDLTAIASGTAGFLIAQVLGLNHLQEVFAAGKALKLWAPTVRTAIELGGEDAKIIFFGPSLEQRMNGACAGGTGAFIDQMASLLNVSITELDHLASLTDTTHAIASRCGVFAKSDVQGLLANGTSLPEVARSVMQAVVLQTISGLGFGKKIVGPLVYLGGPFHFLPSLKQCFNRHLHLEAHDIWKIEHDLFAVGYGCILQAMQTPSLQPLPVEACLEKLEISHYDDNKTQSHHHLPPLTPALDKTDSTTARVVEKTIPLTTWSEAVSPFFLGIDSGSTTSKICLTDSLDQLVFHRYQNNDKGSLLQTITALKEMYDCLPKGALIANSGVTGYGEGLLSAALGITFGEVETLAHTRAALSLSPSVDTILDIGGQDMKCITLKNGVITDIVLNEACSSGCGSFLQTFADGMNLSLPEFCRLGLSAKHPTDLGTRCTVFMNSKIKEAQRDGASQGDLSAGLAYSVIRNALYKVLKLSTASELGKIILAQGGTFKNDAVLQALALETQATILRPSHPELMGAYGMAILAREGWQSGKKSSLLSASQLQNFSSQMTRTNCKGCTNQCSISRFSFFGGGRFISGNRCERMSQQETLTEQLPNLYRFKERRLFAYTPLPDEEAPLGRIGIPRVLNMYEYYPFWFTLLTKLGYRVELSPASTNISIHDGWEYLSSDTICYPAKVVYSHVLALINQGFKRIFYPCIPREPQADKKPFRFNCPIVTSFPEVIRANLDPLREHQVQFDTPFLPTHQPQKLWKHLRAYFPATLVSTQKLRMAIKAAYSELQEYRHDVQAEGQRALDWLENHPEKQGIVLAGRPYHLDGEIHHGIPDMIEGLGAVIISEDALPEPLQAQKNVRLRVIDQWNYQHRLYTAAAWVAQHAKLQLVQLNSFGCGLDAITIDQIDEILKGGQKRLTLLRIDENSQLGAARIRLRSLLGSPPQTSTTPLSQLGASSSPHQPKRTLLIAQMSPLHFSYLREAFCQSGFPAEILPPPTFKTVEIGLKHVNHDICYPAIIIIGQMIQALQSGQWDPKQVSLLLSQTGGGCRASNYVALLQRALEHAGFEQVPIISLAGSSIESPAIPFSVALLRRLLLSQSLGDLELRLQNRFHPYVPDELAQIMATARPGLHQLLHKPNAAQIRRACLELCQKFLPFTTIERRPRVGLVGEIFIKYNSLGNNNLVDSLEKEGAEVVQPDIIGFAQYCAYDRIANHRLLSESFLAKKTAQLFIAFSEKIRQNVLAGLALLEPGQGSHHSIGHLASLAEPMLSTGHQCGEGWYLTAEMAAMIESGIHKIICVQPFGCLANHISGRGMISALKNRYPFADLLSLDYDPGSSATNQYNRLKLFLSDWQAPARQIVS